MPLYLAVELCAIAIPLAFSFDRKVAYFRMWPFLLPAILITALLFIPVDIYFTSRGTWGFNPQYHSGFLVAGLPAEEILFFFIVPYCSLFVHYVFTSYFPLTALSLRATRLISALLVILLSVSFLFTLSREYTAFYSLLTTAVILTALIIDPQALSRFYISFLIIMIPFMLMNSILTGSFIHGEVFWYNRSEITGIRLFTIPVEDVLFGFSMILLNLLTAEFLKKKLKR